MSSRVVPFVNGEYYHVFNRGVAKMQIFFSFYDYTRFTKTFLYYMIDCAKPKFSIFTPTTHELDTNKRIVEVICYCLMPNHFHFLLRQKREGGITEFISKLSNSYTKYFNVKNRRIGPMLQGEFKAVHIETNEQLLHLSRYIHLNPLVGYITKDLENYRWSSYMEYIGFIKNDTCSKEVVLDQFKSLSEYKQFVLDQEDYGKKLESIKHQLIDSED
ncbi:MAG: transposase [Candidatus Levybacteria bacterium]|nr:transposase [Candidatus Levybacteria bacterium]MBI3092847.1 transposase [Candidatus Levybacteria bacterium]